MSAAVIPFPGEWQGRFEHTPHARREQNKAQRQNDAALHDARLIRAAKTQNDDWTARMLLAILETLPTKQRELIEFRLLGPTLNSEAAVQALAIIQLQNGDIGHRERVKSALTMLNGGPQ